MQWKNTMSCTPILVMMDITMPNMDGLEALKAIRAKDPNANVVMCSAMGQESMVIDAVRSGAKDFIVKPFKPDRVLKTVSSIVGNALTPCGSALLSLAGRLGRHRRYFGAGLLRHPAAGPPGAPKALPWRGENGTCKCWNRCRWRGTKS